MTTYSWVLTPTIPSTPPTYPPSELSIYEKLKILIPKPLNTDTSLVTIFCTALETQLDILRTVVNQVVDTVDLNTTTGIHLDRFGRLLGVPRGSFTDDEYRAILQIQHLVMKSDGTYKALWDIIERLLSVFNSNSFDLAEYPPKCLYAKIHGTLGFNPQLLFSRLRVAKQAGTNIQMVYSLHPTLDTFTFDGVTSQGFGSGKLSGVLSA